MQTRDAVFPGEEMRPGLGEDASIRGWRPSDEHPHEQGFPKEKVADLFIFYLTLLLQEFFPAPGIALPAAEWAARDDPGAEG